MNVFEPTKLVEQWLEQSAMVRAVVRAWCAMVCILQILARPRITRNQKNVSRELWNITNELSAKSFWKSKNKTTCREVKAIY